MSNPSLQCYNAALDLLKYLNGTKEKKLVFPGSTMIPDGLSKHATQIRNNHGFVAYSDSSWGNKYPYPMFGYCVYLFGGLVSFASKQMKIVALSSCEAEYVAAVACCKEITFIRNICADLGLNLTGSLILAVDNTAAVDVAHNQGVSVVAPNTSRCLCITFVTRSFMVSSSPSMFSHRNSELMATPKAWIRRSLWNGATMGKSSRSYTRSTGECQIVAYISRVPCACPCVSSPRRSLALAHSAAITRTLTLFIILNE